ncbi:SAM-dependent methyltransferase [Corallococcus sp. H22C18031201]|uniref:class I SAM-dependent methyltransferase n=1 Tax=Citreicoccus inhibens TaxID=2849499 RepID=UPI000E75EB83|nr:class I SAM-dependent methyltransferase [Citreicoccus inhibens]MBU8900161.1 class I SAM-dependent methyltransferase [Citreicoccus inhibens]RJS21798.1 SAM-dependent methyltransferase [Corallococcus sp. H22C18031201]
MSHRHSSFPHHALLGGTLLLGACTHPHHAEQAHGSQMPHRFEDANAWAARFDDPARDAWQQPDAVVTALALPGDAKVADVGSATGYFSVRLARAVPQGRVYGVDIEPDMARYLGARAEREGLTNLTPVVATPDDPKLPAPVDLVLVVDTYHHISDRPAYFRHLAEHGLSAQGRLAIIDYRLDSSRGPPAEHKLAPDAVRAELESAGYQQVRSFDFLPEQYFLVFSRR